MIRAFSTYFWICLVVFTVNQFLEKAGIFIPYVHSYLDDLLCPGIVLGFTLTIQQQLTLKNNRYLFNRWHVVFFVIWYAILFEVIFPSFDARHHRDVWDVLAYAAGGTVFWFFGNVQSKIKWTDFFRKVNLLQKKSA